ncbi:hypothetical protein GBAR_LOCUS28928 [Geodia barretti]|uniref:Uncharacterized protein n=1 Tax=Geodia barretti TaxID=519541 RepID=A0AA35XBR5_GEOBA|nr:hypothetical protein GBAR_LOCUS28928 [Geodia barretti]
MQLMPVAVVTLLLFDCSSGWLHSLSSLEFLELGSSSANLTGSLPQETR